MLFCASIKDTPNWYSDGPVLGSYIGVFNHRQRKLRAAVLLTDQDGKALKEKVESVEVLRRDGRETKIVAVADNDLGDTRLIMLTISWGQAD